MVRRLRAPRGEGRAVAEGGSRGLRPFCDWPVGREHKGAGSERSLSAFSTFQLSTFDFPPSALDLRFAPHCNLADILVLSDQVSKD